MNQKIIIKSLLEGLAVSVAAYYLTNKKINVQGIIMIGLVTTVTFMILDAYAPSVSTNARIGAGFGIGYGLVGGDDNTQGQGEGNDDSEESNSEDWQTREKKAFDEEVDEKFYQFPNIMIPFHNIPKSCANDPKCAVTNCNLKCQGKCMEKCKSASNPMDCLKLNHCSQKSCNDYCNYCPSGQKTNGTGINSNSNSNTDTNTNSSSNTNTNTNDGFIH